MARTIQQIYDGMMAEKAEFTALSGLGPIDNTQTLLNDVNSNSKVSEWRLWVWVVAVAIWTFEKLQDAFKSEVEAIVNTREVGTPEWYVEQALLYQDGDELILIDGKYQYSEVDEAKRIVRHASIVELPNALVLKVAGDGPTKIPTAKLAGLQAYFQRIKYPGSLDVLSSDADQAQVYYTVFYNPEVDVAAVKAGVEEAITEYLANLDFRGFFNGTDMTDAVQQVPGVNRPLNFPVKIKKAGGQYWTYFDGHITDAGYVEIDPAYPLVNTITYEADV